MTYILLVKGLQMAVNKKRLIDIIIKKVETIDERYPGYHRKLVEIISIIIDHEKRHLAYGTNIKNNIQDLITNFAEQIGKTKN